MKEENRNSYIINHSLQVYLIAAILTSIVGQVNTTIDGIIVSNTLSSDAISVVTLSVPILTVSSLLGSIIISGAVLLFAPAIGNQQYRQANRILTLSLVSLLVFNGLIAATLCIWTDPVARFLTDDERLLPYLIDYLPVSFIGGVVTLLAMSLGQFIEISGRPRLVTKAMVILSSSNILLDLFLVVYFQLGMKGAAIASALSSVAVILSYIPYLTKQPRPFHFNLPLSAESLKLGGTCLLRGLPNAIGTVSVAVLLLGLNAIVMHIQGADGMFILSVCIQIFSIGMLVIGGAGSAITGIGGKLYGERDWNGMKRLFDSIFKKVLGGAALITLLISLFPSLLARLFGADEDLLVVSEQPLRLFSLVLIPLAVNLMLVNVFLITNRGKLASLLMVSLVVCILLTFLACSYWFPSNIWVAFPIGMWLLMFISLAIPYSMSKHKVATHRIYLISTVGNLDSYSVSVNYDFNDVNSKLNDLLFYVSIFDIGEERMTKVQHVLEEIMFHQYDMGKKEQKQDSFDVSIIDQPTRFSIIVKDVGKAYNPLVSYQPGQHDVIDEEQIGIAIVKGLCDEINYKYANGLNCLYLNIKK
ncbi:MATE family efflux transporter [Xylanibacter ruminicola]|uniref:Na+-driven multidrug efflux pump n=1 Tax=Xylanibacter ruminicola TaxID=839 RepID=A0A1M6YRF7_XYLRU|nr:MATE family efflux transporter [Xylanibacter ruminicola]SHL20730.1 Na+-driven multidrug efflux pump [Xylanibacter ruminicola]